MEQISRAMAGAAGPLILMIPIPARPAPLAMAAMVVPLSHTDLFLFHRIHCASVLAGGATLLSFAPVALVCQYMTSDVVLLGNGQ